MHWIYFALYALPFCGVYGHLFVGKPPPFRAQDDITRLIMPLNGDGNASPPIGQQPFPCKGYHVGLDGAAVAQWNAGQSVTFS